MSVRVMHGDCRAVLPTLPAGSVHCCVTSPPYFGLRDYGTATWEGGDPACDHTAPTGQGQTGARADRAFTASVPYRVVCGKCSARRVDQQIGLEETPREYVEALVAVFAEVWRVLRDDGTVWLNLGDSYAANGGGRDYGSLDGGVGRGAAPGMGRHAPMGLKPKDLIGIPWRVAFALQEAGWYLRSAITWCKPNPMPESVTDRPTSATEMVFLLTKQERYFYDAVAIAEPARGARVYPSWEARKGTGAAQERGDPGASGDVNHGAGVGGDGATRNRRNYWTIPTAPYAEAHFATFPPALVEPCILAGTSAQGCCPECGSPRTRVVERARTLDGAAVRGLGAWRPQDRAAPTTAQGVGHWRMGAVAETTGWEPGCGCGREDVVPCVVLDPFAGSGTTLRVAAGLGRDAVGIELNAEYLGLIEGRVGGLLMDREVG